MSDKASRVVDIDALQSKLDRLKSGQFEHYDDDGPDAEHSETRTLIRLLDAAVEEIRGRRAHSNSAEYDKTTRAELPTDVEAFSVEVEERKPLARVAQDWNGASTYHVWLDISAERSTVNVGMPFAEAKRMADEINARTDVPALCAAVREQDKRARHAEQERDAFDKRIAELEAEQAASWSAFEKEALDAIGSEVIGMITDAGSDIPGMIKKLHAHYANKLRIMDERRLEAESRRIKAEEQRDSYKRIASIKKPTASPAQE